MTSACPISLRLARQMKFTYSKLQPCQNPGLHRTVCSGPDVLPVFNEVLDRDHMWRSSDTVMISPDGKLWYYSQGRLYSLFRKSWQVIHELTARSNRSIAKDQERY